MSILIFLFAWIVSGFVIGTVVGRMIFTNTEPLDEDNINN